MGSLVRAIRVYIARIRYYGVEYLWQYPLCALKILRQIPCVEYKEAYYKKLGNDEYVHELPKWFYAQTGERLDLKNPKTFNQKIQWLKIYDRNPEKTILADKYLVREWVKEKIGEKYLIPIIGVWSKFDEIDIESLPDKFALKCNHGSGWNIIVQNKDTIDISECKIKVDKWMSDNFTYKAGFEQHYGDIVPKIIIEEYIENNDGEIYDYKFHCFNGRVEYIQFLRDRKKGLRMAYFNRQWTKMNFGNNHPIIKEEIKRPENLAEMIALAETLAKGFVYVRVDFYRLNNGTIKFGEMTFSPASGTQNWYPKSINSFLGNMIDLSEVDMKENFI